MLRANRKLPIDGWENPFFKHYKVSLLFLLVNKNNNIGRFINKMKLLHFNINKR